ncbi:MAG: hypothetical protein LBI17_02860 [Rickettsiales bacterium]|jgi:hypothetical protein|nr:hypothetical protein [Rickettsiales bacterium]
MGATTSILSSDEQDIFGTAFGRETDKYKRDAEDGLSKAGEFAEGAAHKFAHNYSAGADTSLLPLAYGLGRAARAHIDNENPGKAYDEGRNLLGKETKRRLKDFDTNYPWTSGAIDILMFGKSEKAKTGGILQSVLDSEDGFDY